MEELKDDVDLIKSALDQLRGARNLLWAVLGTSLLTAVGIVVGLLR